MSRDHQETPPLRLEPMTAEEYAANRGPAIETFAHGIAESRRISLDEARARAESQVEGVVPQGVETADLLFRTAWVDDRPVGSIWIGMPDPPDRPDTAWVYFVAVDPEHRGKGYGRAIMLAAETELSGLGVPRLKLNVFGNNTVAIGLYRSLGYEVDSQQMAKALPTA